MPVDAEAHRLEEGLQRLGAPAGALRFYEEHAAVDPRHGHDWVENAVKPLVARFPEWGRRIVRGAAWRAHTNLAFFEAVVPSEMGRAVA